MALVWDASADFVFQGRTVHIPVEENRIEAYLANQAKVGSVNSSKAETEQAGDKIVV